MKVAFPFGRMRRIKGADHELIEIQLDKRGAAKFVLNSGVVPPSGVDLPWGHLDQDDVPVSGAPQAYRLYSHPGTMRWFSPPWIGWPSDIESRVRKTVDRAIELYPEIDAWFATRTLGPHMRWFGFPVNRPTGDPSAS